MSTFLFEEFNEVSAKQWKQKIQYDLKGADYNDSLIWQSLEGIHVKPFYHQDEIATPPSPIVGHPSHWNIGQTIFIGDIEIARKLAKDAVSRGAEAIYFSADKDFNFESLLNDDSFGNSTIYFEFSFLSKPFLLQLSKFIQQKQWTAYYGIDILGNFSRTGTWFENKKQDHEIVTDLLTSTNVQNLLLVDSSLYQNAGANIVQQLAYSLAHVHEYLAGFAFGNNEITFKVAVGSNYFFEIAKLRALRQLYQTLAKEYDVPAHCHIVAVPSKRNKTIYDYNINMLRTTTECMSAILGGANTIINLAYDHLYHKSNEFGERISRNQLLILKSESYFNQVENASDGSYYIESLTTELAEKALALFKKIERNGGFQKQLELGTIQRKIKESAQKEQDQFENGALTLVGTNKYTNEDDKMKHDLELFPFVKIKPRKTSIEPIIERRISEPTEKKRLENE